MLVGLSVDRWVAITWPIFYKTNTSPKISIYAGVLTFLAMFLLNVPFLFLYDVTGELGCNQRKSKYLVSAEAEQLVLLMFLVLWFAVPFFSILVCNIYIGYKLKRGISSSVSRREKEITNSLVLMSLTFFVMRLTEYIIGITAGFVSLSDVRSEQLMFQQVVALISVSVFSTIFQGIGFF